MTQSKGGDAGRADPGVGYEANFPDHPSASPAQPAPLCQVCGVRQYSVGYWHYGAFIAIEDDHFDNAPAAHQRAAERNQQNPADWIVVLLNSEGLCQHCRPDLARQTYIIEPVKRAKQLSLF